MAREKSTKKKKKEVVVEEEKKSVTLIKESNNYKLWEVIVIAIIAVIFGLIIGALISYRKFNREKNKDRFDEIREVYDSITSDYYGELDKDALVDGAIRGMMCSLNDPYAMFLDKESAQQYNENLSGDFIGAGITITPDESNRIIVIDVMKDTPADKAGFKVNDIIIKMDDVDYNYDNYMDMIYKIKSSKVGEKRTFRVLRESEEIDLTVVLDKIEVDSVYSSIYEIDDRKVGIITITNFASNTYSQFLEHYKELDKVGITSLVIDVRENGGGYISSANRIASLFLDKDTVLYQKTDGKTTEKIVNENEKTIFVPVVLIVNENTASSAEIFVSSLVDNLNVDVVGVKTYGKGMVQKIMPLKSDAYIKYTVLEWLTSKGQKIDGVGIMPTKEVEYSETSETDDQLDEAINIAINK